MSKEAIETVAAYIAYWWRMSYSDDYSEPECEAPYWEPAAKLAVRELQRRELLVPPSQHSEGLS